MTYGIPTIDWTTVSAKSSAPSRALEQFAVWLAQDAAMFATKAERGELTFPEAIAGIAEGAGLAEAVGIREDFDGFMAGRISEIRTEREDFAKKNGRGKEIHE